MRKLFILALILCISLTAQAHIVETNSENEVNDNSLSTQQGNLKFKGCTETEVNALQESTDYLISSIDKLQNQVKNYPDHDLTKSEKEFIKKVSNKLSCAKKRVTGNLTFKCTENKHCGDNIMYVYALKFISKEYQHIRKINVCDSAFYYDNKAMSGIILHEATHLCGTDDIEYLFEVRELNTTPQFSYNYKITRKSDVSILSKRKSIVNGDLPPFFTPA